MQAVRHPGCLVTPEESMPTLSQCCTSCSAAPSSPTVLISIGLAPCRKSLQGGQGLKGRGSTIAARSVQRVPPAHGSQLLNPGQTLCYVACHASTGECDCAWNRSSRLELRACIWRCLQPLQVRFKFDVAHLFEDSHRPACTPEYLGHIPQRARPGPDLACQLAVLLAQVASSMLRRLRN